MAGHALSTVTVTLPRPGAATVGQDWRFAELAVQCHLDPTLATRYAVEPYEVLAEFGMPVREGTPIPALPAGLVSELTITRLDPRDLGLGTPTVCASMTAISPPEWHAPELRRPGDEAV